MIEVFGLVETPIFNGRSVSATSGFSVTTGVNVTSMVEALGMGVSDVWESIVGLGVTNFVIVYVVSQVSVNVIHSLLR